MFDGTAFGKEMVGIVKGYVSKAIDPLVKRLEALEGQASQLSETDIARMIANAVAALPKPENGKDADMGEIARHIGEAVATAVGKIEAPGPDEAALRFMVAEEVAKLPPALDGKDVDMAEVKRKIAEAVAGAVGGIVVPGPDEAMIRGAVADEVAKLPPVEPGPPGGLYSPTQEEIKAILAPLVADAVSAIPAPQDGKSVTVADVAPVIAAEVAKAVDALPAAKDGVGLASALIDRAGNLVVTLSNGSTKELGVVVGQDVDQEAIEQRIKEMVGAIPPAKDGVDGLGFDDMAAEYDGERGITLRFVRGDQTKEFAFTMPVIIDRGVWAESRDGGYAKGDAVTWAGSVWISQKDGNADKPDGGEGWRLSVKRGRDGKDGVVRDMSPKPVKVA